LLRTRWRLRDLHPNRRRIFWWFDPRSSRSAIQYEPAAFAAKIFVIDPIQIFEAAIAGADAVLLIVAALEDAWLKELRSLAEDELGLDALVEVNTSEELRRALNSGARIVGINNRDLGTFQVSLNTASV